MAESKVDRQLRLRRQVCEHLAAMLESEVENNDENLKEVWETCTNRADQAVVTSELQEIVRVLRGRWVG